MNYCGARDETITFVGHGGGTITLDPPPLPVAEVPDALKSQAGPAATYRD